jgi:hypothetical protein
MIQAVSLQPGGQDSIPVRSLSICGKQGGDGTIFSSSISVSLCSIIPPMHRTHLHVAVGRMTKDEAWEHSNTQHSLRNGGALLVAVTSLAKYFLIRSQIMLRRRR